MVSVESHLTERVMVKVELELESSWCKDIVWNPLNPGGLRDFLPIPVLRTQKKVTEKLLEHSQANFSWSFEAGVCKYAPKAVYVTLRGEKLKAFYAIHELKGQGTADVELKPFGNELGNTYWREWRQVPYSPQVEVDILP